MGSRCVQGIPMGISRVFQVYSRNFKGIQGISWSLKTHSKNKSNSHHTLQVVEHGKLCLLTSTRFYLSLHVDGKALKNSYTQLSDLGEPCKYLTAHFLTAFGFHFHSFSKILDITRFGMFGAHETLTLKCACDNMFAAIVL